MKALQKTAISAAAVALLTGLSSISAFAEEAAAEAPEVSPVTANVTVVNDYRYRGLTQSNFKPAIQGGFDYAHESGLYIGNWNSSISWIGDSSTYTANGTKSVSAPIEMDFYAGFKKEFIGEGFASDFGVLQYYYPTSGLANGATSPNSTELYAAQNFTFGPVTGFAKVSYAVSTLFGTTNSTGSYYPDLTANYDTGVFGLTVNGHVGDQGVTNTQTVSGVKYNFSYTDWKLGVTKDFGGGLSGALAYVGTTQPKAAGSYLWYSPNHATTQSQGKAGGLISLTKTF